MQGRRSRRTGRKRLPARWLPLIGISLVAAACTGSEPDTPEAPAADEAATESAASAEPERNPLRNAYFGDLHVHTSWSLDAYAFGHPMNNDPSVAYRYGRGEPILDPEGNVRGQLRTPLDFMAVTDHDNFMGEVQLCQDPEADTYDLAVCQEIRAGGPAFLRHYNASNENRRDLELCGSTEPGPDNRCDQRAAHLWPMVQEIADAYYEPSVFTTFTAFEFTASDSTTGGWLHRNVFFRGDDIPPWGGASITIRHSPERLWEWMDESCTGDCDVIAIPHNTNYGMGVVLAPNNADGTPFTAEILERRARREPLIEIHQVKGNSECAAGAAHLRRGVQLRAGLRAVRSGSTAVRSGACCRQMHGGLELRPQRAQDRPGSRGRARHQPVQVRHHRQHRRPPQHVGVGRRGDLAGRLLRRDRRDAGRGRRRTIRAAWRPSGPKRTRATPSSTMPSGGARRSRRAGPASGSASSAAGNCPPTCIRATTWSKRATAAACRWAETCRRRRPAVCGGSRRRRPTHARPGVRRLGDPRREQRRAAEAARSSRAGTTRTAPPASRCTTWRATAACPRTPRRAAARTTAPR